MSERGPHSEMADALNNAGDEKASNASDSQRGSPAGASPTGSGGQATVIDLTNENDGELVMDDDEAIEFVEEVPHDPYDPHDNSVICLGRANAGATGGSSLAASSAASSPGGSAG